MPFTTLIKIGRRKLGTSNIIPYRKRLILHCQQQYGYRRRIWIVMHTHDSQIHKHICDSLCNMHRAASMYYKTKSSAPLRYLSSEKYRMSFQQATTWLLIHVVQIQRIMPSSIRNRFHIAYKTCGKKMEWSGLPGPKVHVHTCARYMLRIRVIHMYAKQPHTPPRTSLHPSTYLVFDTSRPMYAVKINSSAYIK